MWGLGVALAVELGVELGVSVAQIAALQWLILAAFILRLIYDILGR
jgi:hypothetical protein